MFRRDFLKNASGSLAAVGLFADPQPPRAMERAVPSAEFDVRRFGAKGDGTTIDSAGINAAISAAAQAGGGTVVFPAGLYLCYTIRLQSNVALRLGPGCTIIAASTPNEGTTTGGYDAAGPAQPWEAYQDYGHNHWANSLIYGEDLHNISIHGEGLIWGRGLSRGDEDELPLAESPGVGNKAIGLKNCRNVQLREFSVLSGGHFAILLTGVDNVVVDGLTIDTNRDGIDIDCCHNVRVSNCVVSSPYDDGICPKSSFALGYERATENVLITNCYVTAKYEIGSIVDGSYKKIRNEKDRRWIGRIKLGTESNGGFRNITVTNCVLESCRGLALISVDGAVVEDICISNIVMRDVVHSPLFICLGKRYRDPAQRNTGAIRRVMISNICSVGATHQYPSMIVGVPGAVVEDIHISDMYWGQLGGASREWAAIQPAERPDAYPDADMYGHLPATGLFVRHARNVQLSNVEVATEQPDARVAVWARDVDGLDIFRMTVPRHTKAFDLKDVSRFRVFGCRDIPDARTD